jgi:hypothetical protein
VVGSTDDVTVFDTIYQEEVIQQSFSVHPDYELSSSPFFAMYDFAIIVLEDSYSNNNVGFIAPAVSDYVVEEEQLLTIMGRGKTGGSDDLAEIMQKVVL